MKFFKLLLFVLTIGIVLQSCKKESNPFDGSVTNKIQATTPTATNTTPPVYTFSGAQAIYKSSYYRSIISVSAHNIAILAVLSSGRSEPVQLHLVSTTNFTTKDYDLGYTGIDYIVNGTLDKEEKNYYFVNKIVPTQLYRYDLTKLTLTDVVGRLGNVNTIKSLGGGVIAITTDSLGGSLMTISATGAKTVLAKNLGYAGSFCSFNNQYYVVNNNIINSAVLAISNTGVASTIINNLTGVRMIAADINGNLIVQNQVTLGGAPYQVYDLYTPAGVFIHRLTDNTGNPIIDQPTDTELYVDGFNNLFFNHLDASLGTTDFSYPSTTYNGIWKVQMLKQ